MSTRWKDFIATVKVHLYMKAQEKYIRLCRPTMHSVIESTKSWKETSPKPPSSVATLSITYTLICFKELLKYLMLVVAILNKLTLIPQKLPPIERDFHRKCR